jgi:hypothetical protein
MDESREGLDGSGKVCTYFEDVVVNIFVSRLKMSVHNVGIV